MQDTSAPFTFTGVHAGVHAVRVMRTGNPKPGTIVAQDTIVVQPGGATAIDLWF